jgi:glycosyltransferase involved in cell wall biosynthesis
MHIAYLNPVGALGGAERCLLTMLSAVRQARPDAELHLIAAGDGPLLAQAEALGVRPWVVPMPARLVALGDSAWKDRSRLGACLALAPRALAALPAVRRYREQLLRTLHQIRPDLVHSNGIKTHLLIRLAGWDECPVVWHLHDFLGQRPLMGRVLGWARRSVAGAVAISQAVREDAANVLPGLPVEVVYNATNVEEFSPAPRDGRWLDDLAGLPPAPSGTQRVGLVATFARWKGQPLFLEAAARLIREQPGAPIRFYIVGGPIYQTRGSQFSEAELRAQATAWNLGDRVGFIGFQPQPADVYRALDVVVHASTQPEPFGLTIIEAMACGRPVIVSQAGGAAELFTPGHDAVGVPPGDAQALVRAMKQLLESSEDCRRLGGAARRTVVARFSQQRFGREIGAYYDRLRVERNSFRSCGTSNGMNSVLRKWTRGDSITLH